MGEGSTCCQCGCCKNKKWCGIIVLALLILNTVFIGGIWRATGGVCVFSGQHKFSAGKMCPMTGKTMHEAGAKMMDAAPQQ